MEVGTGRRVETDPVIALFILLALACGWRASRPLIPLGMASRAGAALLAGAGVLTFVLLTLSVIGARWSPLLLLSGSAIAAAIFILPRPLSAAAPARRSATGVPGILADVAILALIAGHIRWILAVPLYEWDFAGIWGLKGRTFQELGGIDWGFLQVTASRGDYPLMLPLLFDSVTLTRGWSEISTGLLYTVLATAAILVARGALREELGPGWRSAAGALAFAGPALTLWVGLADGVVAVYAASALIVLRGGVRAADRGQVLLGGLLLGCTGWIKNEGLALIVVAMIVLAATLRREQRKLLAYAFPAVIIPLPWMLIRLRLGLTTDFVTGSPLARAAEHLSNPKLLAAAFIKYPPDPRLFWAAAILALLWSWRRALTSELFLTVTLIAQMALYVAQAVFTRYDLVTHIVLTWNRLPSQLAPAFAFLCAVLLLAKRDSRVARTF